MRGQDGSGPAQVLSLFASGYYADAPWKMSPSRPATMSKRRLSLASEARTRFRNAAALYEVVSLRPLLQEAHAPDHQTSPSASWAMSSPRPPPWSPSSTGSSTAAMWSTSEIAGARAAHPYVARPVRELVEQDSAF